MDIYEALQDLIELTTPQCVIGIDTAYTYADDEGQDVEYGCDVTLTWYDDQLQASVTAPLCRIGIPEEGKGYDISTLYWGGTSADWDYYINVAGLSEDEEIALQDLMDDKMAWYDPKQSGYELNIEHY
jgi:hypothetical protein